MMSLLLPSAFSTFPESTAEGREPEFRETFYGRTLYPGSSLNMKCSASGMPMPQIRWFRYDRLLNDPMTSHRRDGFRIADYVDSEGNIISHLNITSVSIEDGGLYSCEAVNDYAIIKHSGSIQIHGPPMIHPMGNVSVISSGKLVFDCPTSGYPIQEITWRKGKWLLFPLHDLTFDSDGKEISPSKRMRTFPNGTFNINDAHMEDEGWYICQAKNWEGQSASRSMFLDVIG